MSSNSVLGYIDTANGLDFAVAVMLSSRPCIQGFQLHWGPLINCVNSHTKLNLGCLEKFELHKTPSGPKRSRPYSSYQ